MYENDNEKILFVRYFWGVFQGYFLSGDGASLQGKFKDEFEINKNG